MYFDPLTVAIVLGISSILLIGASFYSVFIFFRGIQLAPLFEKRARLLADIASCQNTLHNLEVEIQSKQAEKANAERLIGQGESERQWLEEHHDEVASLKAQIANTKNALQADMDKHNEILQDLQDTKMELQKTAGENQRLSTENRTLQQDIAVQQRNRESLDRELQHLTAEKDKAKQEDQLIQKELLAHRAELEKLNHNIESQRAAQARLTEEIMCQQAEVEELKTCRNDLRTRCHQEEDKLHNLISKCIEQGPMNEAAKWQDLNRPVFNITPQNVKKNLSETLWLENFKVALKENGIKFHDRMIHAFHTGLKVADYSPLVVLAGISGTGKSLLPRLYAKAIGMNFLQIAVQPRWDNPQDMFGFYNYMEGRYKATELSRMLWEFDIFNNQEAGKKYHSALPMNLVLLDEMNLAKVEYYFSDMLSKLEVRRGVNPENRESRRNAEIEIESGSPQKAAEAKRLYVGRNTLFVGTMNEDESTQSLSDKVIDRSNVLRFGKPHDLTAQPNIRGFEAEFNNPQQLDFNTWRNSWIRSESRFDGQTCKIISDINNELAQIGRPFAYRVFGAIQAYIHNYPNTDHAFADAMADQIEMKVLPKLNGIDKESSSAVKQALNRIGETISDLGDEKLTEAFYQAKDNKDEIFFHWRGVSR